MPLLPLLIPFAGLLAAKAIRHMLKDEPAASVRFAETRTTQFKLGRSGHGLTIWTTLEGSGADALAGAVILVRPKVGNAYLKSKHTDFADSDGDITAGGPVSRTGTRIEGIAHIPFVAFPDPDIKINLEVAVVKDGKCRLGPSVFTEITLEGTKFDRRHALAAICDASIAAVRIDQALDRAHIRTAKEAMIAAWQLDEHGLRVLQRNLKRAASTPLGDPWFDPVRLATDIGDELEGDDRVCAVRMLYAIAAAVGPIGYRADDFLSQIGRLLSTADDEMVRIRESFTSGPHLAILGLGDGATIDDVKHAYRRAVKACHPDVLRHLDDAQRTVKAEEFRRLTTAYEALLSRTL